MIGDRWAEICSDVLAEGTFTIERYPMQIERVIRLDDIPEIAAAASRRKLQNPDFLLLGTVDGVASLAAVDAKFSVETARSKQVSAEVTTELLAVGPLVTDHVGALPESMEVLDGFFLSPDYSLSHYLMRQKRGNHRVMILPEEVMLLRADPAEVLGGLEGIELADIIAGLDHLPVRRSESLLLSLYYFRLARACIGCWIDQTRPLLGQKQTRPIDLDAILAEARELARDVVSGWELVLRWDDRAEAVRRQRLAIDHVAAVPINGPELRKQIEDAALAAGVEPPSVNSVRRRIGAWYRQVLLDEFGPLDPPLPNFGDVLNDIGTFTRSLRNDIPARSQEIILDMVTAAPRDTF